MNTFIEFEFSKNQEKKPSSPFKIFWITSVGIFILVVLQHVIPHLPTLQSPIPSINASVLEMVRPKLEQKTDTYEVKKKTSFISKSYAAENFDYDLASSYAVIDYNTGDIILDKQSDKKVPIASLTKIMTAVVALDLASPMDLFEVSDTASKIIPTKIVVIPGEKFTLEELLHAALMTSANDSVEVMKEGINQRYGSDIFIDAMNEKAKILGLENSHFTNPQGFDNPNHYSSASDLAKLSHYALTHYPLIAEIVKKDYLSLNPNSYHRGYDLYNWNGLLDVYPNVEGIKIGNTGAARTTTVVVSSRAGRKILVVLLGAPGILERDMWASTLLDKGFEQLGGLTAINVTEQELRNKYATWRYVN